MQIPKQVVVWRVGGSVNVHSLDTCFKYAYSHTPTPTNVNRHIIQSSVNYLPTSITDPLAHTRFVSISSLASLLHPHSVNKIVLRIAKMTETFLITGASGLIGFRILLAALAAGHNVRYTVRSEEKAKIVSNNPAVKKLGAGERLVPIVIPDLTIDGAFDSAVQKVTHIIHTGSPVPVPTFDPTTQVYEPT